MKPFSTVRIYSSTLTELLSGHLPKGKFLHNLSVVMTGTAIAQLFGLAMMPVVSRLFAPADFGIFGTFYSIVGIWSAFITLSYNHAVVLPKHKEEALNLFIIALLCVALVTGLTATAAILFPSEAQHLLKAPNRWFLPLFIVAISVMGLNHSLEAWCTRASAFTTLAISQIVRMISAVGIWIAVGFGHMGAPGLVLGLICGDILASLNLGRVFKADLMEGRGAVSWLRIKNLALEYSDFPKYAAPQWLMSALSKGLPVILLGYFYEIGVAGFYAFGIRILQTPIGFISAPLWQVLFQRGSEIHNQDGDLYPLFLKATGSLLVIILVPVMILFAWGPQIFSWIFGNDWWEAGVYAQWLILWIAVTFVTVPSRAFASILRQQRNLFFYEWIILLSRTIVLVMGGLYWTSLTTVILFSVLGFIIDTLFILWVGVLLHTKRQERIRQRHVK